MSREGFTLIELLIVIVILGVLAVIAIVKFGESRDRAYVAAMQADMNQMRTAMELCYEIGHSYAGCAPTVHTSRGVNLVISAQTGTDYLMDATHESTGNWACTYAHDSGANPGLILCTET